MVLWHLRPKGSAGAISSFWRPELVACTRRPVSHQGWCWWEGDTLVSGVGSERFEVRDRSESESDHLAIYGELDIVRWNVHAARRRASPLQATGLNTPVAANRDATLMGRWR
jgi:hypothetical protein